MNVFKRAQLSAFSIILTAIFLGLSVQLIAQTAPQKMNYQGVARDASGKAIIEQIISLRIGVLSSTNMERHVYAEEHEVTTNKLGLFTLHIGDGKTIEGQMKDINWGATDHYISVELDTDNSGRFVEMGVSQLLSVPYAFYSERSGTTDDNSRTLTSDGWVTHGNTGTDAATDFIGTSDAQDLVFRTNNTEVGRFTTGGDLGLSAGNEYMIGGGRALAIDGAENIFMGPQTGSNISTGNGNLMVGHRSGRNTTTGRFNSFLGYKAGESNTVGNYNSFFGALAGVYNTGGNNNFFGRSAGYANTGNSNNFFGNYAGQNNQGNNNTFIGLYSGQNNTTGNNNTFLGRNAGLSNTTGTGNTYIGRDADGTSGLINATAIGTNASVTQSNSVVLGNNANVGIGTSAPSYLLDVKGDVGIQGRIYDTSGDAGTSGQVLSTTGTGTNWVDAGSGGATGPTGPTGVAGTNGSNGTNGATGATGAVGLTGAAGTNGTNGINGATGTAGTNGTNGATGANGTNGATGPTGAAGATGATGPAASGNTLDEAYDQGGVGSGRAITADNGAVRINGGDGFIVTGTYGSGDIIEVSGAGQRMFFNPRDAAFRAGSVDGTQWDYANIGYYSVALGSNTIASGQSATAMGFNSDATNSFSTAMGWDNTASGHSSTSLGQHTTASGTASLSVGAYTEAESGFETVLGRFDTDYTPNSTTDWDAADRLFVVGNGTGFSGLRSDALVILKNGNTGIGTSTPTQLLHLSGTSGTDGIKFPDGTVQTTAFSGGGNTLDAAYDQGGQGAGRTITADSGAVHISGEDGFLVTGTFNTGDSILISGAGTRMFFNPKKSAFRAGTASSTQWNSSNVGDYSTAMGLSTIASGFSSTAMGLGTVASGKYSMAFGYFTTAKSAFETVIGDGNSDYTPNSTTAWNDEDRLFVVANGVNILGGHNAMVILKNGNTGIGISLPKAILHIEDNMLVTGTFGTGYSVNVSGEGSRMIFNSRKAAFRAGDIDSDQWDDGNIGNYSAAMGRNTEATGNYSFSMGLGATASGHASDAWGQSTTASGYWSTAKGFSTTASGRYAVAMGGNTSAESGFETTIGQWNTDYTPQDATGWNVLDRLFVVGNGTVSSSRSDALVVLKSGKTGIGPSVPLVKLHVSDKGGILVTGTFGGADSTLVSGAGERMFFNPERAAFRAGSVDGTQWDAANVGNYSFASGLNTTASNDYAIAAGRNSVASGQSSVAMGFFNSATGSNSTAFGRTATASGNDSFAAGYRPTAGGASSTATGEFSAASGDASVAMGYYCNASSNYAMAAGQNSVASGIAAISLGKQTTASGDYSTAFSELATATGVNSFAAGYRASAGGIHSIAMGRDASASGDYSVSLGLGNVGSGSSSFASGTNSVASGVRSVAMSNATASGYASVAIGSDIIAESSYETVIGRYDTDYTPVETGSSFSEFDRLFVVGNGDGFTRSDAMVILKNGNTGIDVSNPQTKLHVSSGNWDVSTTNGDMMIGDGTYNLKFGVADGGGGAGIGRINMVGGLARLYLGGAGNDVLAVTGSNVGVGITTPGYLFHVNGTAAKPGGGSWTAVSDRRLKQNVRPYTDGLEKILSIEPVNFHYNQASGMDTKPEYVGVIAQELKEIAPYMVGNFEKDGTEYYDVNNSAMMYMMVNAIKELNERLKTLEDENKRLMEK
ncbi:MAG: tail fiber domain-containing protein [Flavobacteriales bacterium]|nr:tail fiber domain-containing protein [Flavobacteriales bacterium]